MRTTIALMLIGQTPRPDFVSLIEDVTGGGVDIMEIGALDDLSPEECENLYGEPDDYRLSLGIRGGNRIEVAAKHIIARIPQMLENLEKKGVKLATILCTEKFPQFPYQGVWLKPQQLMFHFVSSLNLNGRGVVFFPLEEQRENVMERWPLAGAELDFRVLIPGSGDEEIEKSINRLAKEKPDFIVLDCFGYDRGIKQRIKAKVSCPVVLAITVLGNTIKEIACA